MISATLLGAAELRIRDLRVTPSSARKFALLLYLSAEAERTVTRSFLQDLIYFDQPERNARHSLRELMYQLRLAGADIRSDRDSVRIGANAVETDVASIIATGRPTISQMRQIAGGLLPGYSGLPHEPFRQWYEQFRATTVRRLCKLLVSASSHARRGGDWDELEYAARATLALDPLNEEATLTLAEVTAIVGSKSEAVDLLDRYLEEVGSRGSDLQVPATVLRRRIRESASSDYGRASRSRLIGRSDEIARLQDCLTTVLRGGSRSISVVGEAGVGKSRLISEFAHIASLTAARIEMAYASPSDFTRPFAVFSDLLPRLLQVPGALGCDPNSLVTARSLGGVTRRLARTGDRPAPRDLANEMIAALSDVVQAIASELPLVLIIEDVHWLDAASWDVLRTLTSQHLACRLLIVLTAREIDQQEFSSETTTIQLKPLNDRALRELACAALAREHTPCDDVLLDWIVRTSGGLPLFAELLVEHIARTGERFGVPTTLADLIRTRLGSLSPDAQRALRAVVLLGRHATPARVDHVTSQDSTLALRTIEELEQSGIVIWSDGVLAAGHSLIGDEALRGCSPLWLTFAHRRAAESLSHSVDEGQSAVAWDCAEHWLRAGETQRATSLFVRCAEHAASVGQATAAIDIWRRLLTLQLSASDRAATARRLIITAHELIEPAVVIEAAEHLRSAGVQGTHDDEEIIELNALWTVLADADGLPHRFMSCIRSDATDSHAYKAAITGLKYANVYGNDDLIAAICDAVQSRRSASVPLGLRLEFDMIREAISGDPTNAVHLARRLLEHSANASVLDDLKHRTNAALVLLMAGMPEDALQILEVPALATSSEETPGPAMRTAVFKASVLIDLYRDGESREQLEIASEIVGRRPSLEAWYNYTVVRVELALAFGAYIEAGGILNSAATEILQSNSRGGRRWVEALHARHQQLAFGARLSDDQIRTLQFGARIGPLLGMRDLEMAVVIHQARVTTGVAAARRVAADYLATRNSRSIPSRALQDELRVILRAHDKHQ